MEEQSGNKLIAQDQRKSFARQAGISEDMLKDLQLKPLRRQTRHKKQPQIEPQVKQVKQKTKPVHQSRYKTPRATYFTPLQQSFDNAETPKKDKKTLIPKTPKTLEKVNNIKLEASIPKSVDEFYQNYSAYCGKLFNGNQEALKYIENHKLELFDLLKATIQAGGIVKIISQGQKDNIFGQFMERFSTQETQQIFNIYKKYLLHFEYHLLQGYQFKQYHDATKYFEQATFVEQSQLKEFLDKEPLNPKYFQYDILVFKNGQNAIGIDSNQINLDRVTNHYKDYNIDIRIQNGLDYGFKPKKMRNEPYQMKIGDYRIYQKLCHQYAIASKKIDESFIGRLGHVKDLIVNGTTSFKQKVKNQEIFFGVNFDPDDGLLFDYINEKVNGTFIGYKQQFDLLSYLDHEVPGCSFPQFYFKVKGVWTGGHQENINMCAVNINHGPDSSQWYTMQYKYVQQFRAQLKREHKMDLYGSQGLWYQKINWFVEQGKYPVKKIIQKKGDIVISGPGTLHWVRSYGIALQSAWNQFPITYNMMNYAFHRQEENQRINFIRSNTIPLKILTLKLLNHQPKQLTKQIRELCIQKLKMWYKKQTQQFDSIIDDQSFELDQKILKYQKLQDLQGFCMKCRQQILMYFMNGKKVEDILCLNCFKKEYKGKKRIKTIYTRYQQSEILKLIRFSEKGQPFQQIKCFCSLFVGRVPSECNTGKFHIQKESDYVNKINKMNETLNNMDSAKLKEIKQKIKNKAISNEKQDQTQQKPQVKQAQEKNQDKQQQKMQLQQNHHVQQKAIIEQKKSSIKQYRIMNGIKHVGYKRSQTGWWDFQIPQHLRIVTEKNHSQLLKLIMEQQKHTKTYQYRQNGKRQYHFPYFIVVDKRNQIKQHKQSFVFDQNFKPCEDPKFSDDQSPQKKKPQKFNKVPKPRFSSDQEAVKDIVKKKVHRNQDNQQMNKEKNQSKKQRKNSSASKRSRSSSKDKKIRQQKQSCKKNERDRSKSRSKGQKSRQNSQRKSNYSKRQQEKYNRNNQMRQDKREYNNNYRRDNNNNNNDNRDSQRNYNDRKYNNRNNEQRNVNSQFDRKSRRSDYSHKQSNHSEGNNNYERNGGNDKYRGHGGNNGNYNKDNRDFRSSKFQNNNNTGRYNNNYDKRNQDNNNNKGHYGGYKHRDNDNNRYNDSYGKGGYNNNNTEGSNYDKFDNNRNNNRNGGNNGYQRGNNYDRGYNNERNNNYERNNNNGRNNNNDYNGRRREQEKNQPRQERDYKKNETVEQQKPNQTQDFEY